MKKISAKSKFDLFELLKKEDDAFGLESRSVIDWVSKIWDLRAMPSQDSRYNNFYDEVYQHTVNNEDWDADYLFLSRLNLLTEDKYFNSFIEAVVHPANRENEDEQVRLAYLLNTILEKEGLKLAVSDYDDYSSGIYTIHNEKYIEDWPIEIKKNTIPFFVDKSPNGDARNYFSHKRPDAFPSFILAFNEGWNDYGVKSEFSLFYYDKEETCHGLGKVKIITFSELDTSLFIPDKFTFLNDSFCSLGQSESIYYLLKEHLEKDFESVLYALRDVAFFSEIQERFERTFNYANSLIRDDSSERILREIKPKISGYDLSNLYQFSYKFKPVFSEDTVDVEFDFDNNVDMPNRIYALIGKNGTGKTQFMTSLPLNISKKEDTLFFPKTPIFSKVIAVSYSVFDRFEVPKKTATFNYVYCGLRNEAGEIITERGLVLRFHNTRKKIERLGRIEQWRKVLFNFLDPEIVNEFIIRADQSGGKKYQVDVDGYHRVKNKLSSGQSILLYIISEITANIRYDSLLLYDEPETHLHPNAITQLMNTIYQLVTEFESYCIIATHSPLVIRELFSKNVYVVERHENTSSVRRIGIECFGENITTLIDEVFSNKEVEKQYKRIIQDLADKGKGFDEVVSLLESDNLPLSLNVRIFLKSVISPLK